MQRKRNKPYLSAYDWDNGTDIAATEPTATSEGYYRYKKCAHCSHIILLRGDSSKEIDITNEAQRGAWIIPAGAVMLMEPYNGAFDIVDYDTYVNTALTKTNTVTSATQVRLSKDTQIASSGQNNLVNPSRAIDLELNGHGLLGTNGQAGPITGNSNVTILLSDGNNRKTEFGGKDDIPYTNMSPVSGAPVKYVRKISSTQGGKWQSLYLPFEASRPADTNLGTVNKVENDATTASLWIKENTSGNLQAFTPYFFQHEAGQMVITAASNTLAAYKKDAPAPIDGGSYTIAGSLTSSDRVAETAKNFWSLTNGGGFTWVKVGVGQRPYRWVIYGDPVVDTSNTAPSRALMLYVLEPEEDDATPIQSVTDIDATEGDIYTLSGLKMPQGSQLQRGIYIRNGKKFSVK